MQLLMTLIPIFITIVFLVSIPYKLPKVLRLPREAKEYKKINNILKVFLVIVIVIVVGIALGEITRNYISMAINHLNGQIDNVAFMLLILIPIILQIILYIKMVVLFPRIIKIPNRLDKYKNARSIIEILLAFLISMLVGVFFQKLIIGYFQVISTIFEG